MRTVLDRHGDGDETAVSVRLLSDGKDAQKYLGCVMVWQHVHLVVWILLLARQRVAC